MQCITGWKSGQWGAVAHTLAVVGLVIMVIEGVYVESLGGWVACPPRGIGKGQERPREGRIEGSIAWHAAWVWMQRSYVVAWVRSEIMLLLAVLAGREAWAKVCLLRSKLTLAGRLGI